MTAKEYLNGVRQKELHCRMLHEKIEELYAQAGGLKAITYDKDRIQVSPENRLEELVIRIEEVSAEYAKEIVKCRREVEKITAQIDGMENPLYKEVLRYRYVESDHGRRMSFEKISCLMHKSFDWVRHLHGAALQEFERRYLRG